VGITDTGDAPTSVFAFWRRRSPGGPDASEKQAVDATLQSLSKDDRRICPVADRYWNRARQLITTASVHFQPAEESGWQMADCLRGQIWQTGSNPRRHRVL